MAVATVITAALRADNRRRDGYTRLAAASSPGRAVAEAFETRFSWNFVATAGTGNIAGIRLMAHDMMDEETRQREIEEQLRFEQLLSALSSAFVGLAADRIEKSIHQEVRVLVEFLGMDRGILLEFTGEKPQLQVTHLWETDEVRSNASPCDGPIEKRFPWLTSRILRQETIAVSRLAELPAAAKNERQYCQARGTRSFVVVPLATGDSLLGAIVLDAVGVERAWPNELVQRLGLVGEIFANALSRAKREKALRASESSSAEARQIRSARENERTFSTVFHDSPVGMLFLDRDQRIGKINRAAEKILAGTMGRIEGQAFGDVIRCFFLDPTSGGCGVGPSCDKCAVRGMVHDTFETGLARQGVETQLVMQAKIGSAASGKSEPEKQYLRISTSLLELPEDRQVLVCIEDITIQKQAERDLQQAFSEIQQLKEQLHRENIYLREEAKLQYDHDEIIGQSEAIKRTLEQVEQVADTNATVLLQGETGTGKEVLARAIHRISPRGNRTMITINCAALPSTLVESELFGREAGAYTGALSRQVGRFEIAHRSTILLDEIGELPLELQAKLLRVLEEGQFERLGSSKTITVDVRIIAATNRNLAEAMATGKFRQDLYHRLNVFPITVPPLRERTEDIPPLVWAFAKEFGDKMGKTFKTIPRKTMEALQAYSWPGNVRELRNVVERATILSSGDSLLVEAPRPSAKKAVETTIMTLEECQRKHVTDVLESAGWRIRGRNGAAELLGTKASTLESKMAKLGIVRPK